MDYRRVSNKRLMLWGDRERAASHIGEGNSLLHLCQLQAGFQELDHFQLARNLEDGSRITARTYAGLSDVIIDSPFIGKSDDKEETLMYAPGKFWFYVRTECAEISASYQYFYFNYQKGVGFKFKRNMQSHWEGGGASHPAVVPYPSIAKLFVTEKDDVINLHALDTEEGRERFGMVEEDLDDVGDIIYWIAAKSNANDPGRTNKDFDIYRNRTNLARISVAENFVYNFPYLYFFGGTWGNQLYKLRQLPTPYWEYPEPWEKLDWVPASYNSIQLDGSDIGESQEAFNAHIVTQARIFNGGFCIHKRESFPAADVYDPWQWTVENLEDLKHIQGTNLIQYNTKTVTEVDSISWNWPNEAPGTVGYNFDLGFDPTIVLNKFYPSRVLVQDNADSFPVAEWSKTTYSLEVEARERTLPEGSDLVFTQIAGRWTGDTFHGYYHYNNSYISCEGDPPTPYAIASTFIMHRGFAVEGVVFAKFIGDLKYAQDGSHTTPWNTTFTLPGFLMGGTRKAFHGLWQALDTGLGPEISMEVDGSNAGIDFSAGEGAIVYAPKASHFEVTDQVVDAELKMPGSKHYYIDWKFTGRLEMGAASTTGTPIVQSITPSTTTDHLHALWPMGSALLGDMMVFTSELNTLLDKMKELVNEKRVENSVAELTWEWRLDDICVNSALDVWRTEDPTLHTGWELREEKAKVAFPGLNTFGENAAWQSGLALDAEAIVQGWWDSPGHRENMIRPAFTLGGMAVHIGMRNETEMSVGVCNIFLGSTT